MPERSVVAAGTLSAVVGKDFAITGLTAWLERNGFLRSPTVREPGDMRCARHPRSVRRRQRRAGAPRFWGDTLETIRTFDPDTQRTIDKLPRIDLVPVGEMVLSPETIARFRERYLALFGAADRSDLLYHTVSEGRRYVGMEHWLPLIADKLETLFDHVGDAKVVLDHLVDEATGERFDQIKDHYDSRVSALEGGISGGGAPYKPLPPDRLYLTKQEWNAAIRVRDAAQCFTVRQPEGPRIVDFGGRNSRSFAAERGRRERQRLRRGDRARRRAAEGGQARRRRLLERGLARPHGSGSGRSWVDQTEAVASWPEAAKLDADTVGLGVMGLEAGFETAISPSSASRTSSATGWWPAPEAARRELSGRRHGARAGRSRRPHRHGIARFNGLKTIEALGAPHDCLELLYAGGDRVYLPVENIELLSRYGNEDSEAQLDKLGGVAWQAPQGADEEAPPRGWRRR